MNEQNGIRAIQRLREVLLEERERLVPIEILDVIDGDKTVAISVLIPKGGSASDILNKWIQNDTMYELCITYRKKQIIQK